MEPRPISRGDQSELFPDLDVRTMLQWSRDHSVAETRCARGVDNRNARASMEPRPFSRGDLLKRYQAPPGTSCFNGAATIQSRRQVPCRPVVPAWRCFNGAATIQSRRPDLGSDLLLFLLEASMEPRPFSRGDLGGLTHSNSGYSASMEPRPFSRGDSLYDSTTVTDLSGAEYFTRTLTCAGKLWFVWRSFQPLTGSILPSKLRALPIWELHHRTARIPTPFPIAPHRRHYHITVRPPSPPVPPASAACPTYSAS